MTLDQKKPFVMIAEDNDDLRWLYRQWLSSAGWHVRVVDDGAWALALIPSDPPDVLLLDLNLPEVDGIEVCKTLKDNPELNSIAILVMTSLSDSSTKNHVRAIGADGFLVKPFSRIELVMQMESLLGPENSRPTTDPDLQMVFSHALDRAGR